MDYRYKIIVFNGFGDYEYHFDHISEAQEAFKIVTELADPPVMVYLYDVSSNTVMKVKTIRKGRREAE